MSVAPWYVNQAYAPTYSVGRVLCGGDAVHRHPPSSGLGSNTCVQDGFNLAWKLAYVINGHAGQDLLDSYSLERAPVGQQIVERANQSRKDYAPLRAAFATTDTDGPGRRRPGEDQRPHRRGRQDPGCHPGGVAAQELRVQRARRRTESAVRVGRGHPRPGRRGGAVGPGQAAVPAGHHPSRCEAAARLAGRRGRAPGLHPGCDRAGQVHPADRTVRTGLGRGREEPRPAVPAHRRDRRTRIRRPVLLLAPDQRDRRGRRASRPSRRVRRLAGQHRSLGHRAGHRTAPGRPRRGAGHPHPTGARHQPAPRNPRWSEPAHHDQSDDHEKDSLP